MICTKFLALCPEAYTHTETIENIQDAAKTGAFVEVPDEFVEMMVNASEPTAMGHAGHGSHLCGTIEGHTPEGRPLYMSFRLHQERRYATIETLSDFKYKEAGHTF